MKQPITLNVSREHGNSGDVIVAFTDATGLEQKLAVPGDCTPYHALAALRPFLEGIVNSDFVAGDPVEPEPIPGETDLEPETPEKPKKKAAK